jgi:Flp pilus assembly protein TadB
MNDETLQRLSQAASEAAHAPAVKLSAGASTVVVGTDWLASGPGVIALIGIALTAATFLVNVWAAWRRDKREQMVAEAKLRAIEHVGTDTDPLPLDKLPNASRKTTRPD